MSKSSINKGETGDCSAEKILTATTILDFCGEDHLEDAQEVCTYGPSKKYGTVLMYHLNAQET